MSCAVLPWVEVAAIGRLIKQVDSFVRDAAGRINFRRPDEIERRNIWGVELLQPFLVHGADGEFVFGMPVGGCLSRRTRQKSQEPNCMVSRDLLLHVCFGRSTGHLGGNQPTPIFILTSFDSVDVEC